MPQNNLRAISIAFFIFGIIVFLFLGGIPAIQTFLASTRDVHVLHGIFASPSVGFENFRDLFDLDVFPRMFSNSLSLSLLPAILAIVIAIPFAGIVGSMARSKVRSAATIALLLPAFIPDIILAFLVSVEPDSFRSVMILLNTIRPAAICAFVGACAAGLYRDKGKSVLHGAVVGVIVGSAANFVRFLSTNLELHTLFFNPSVASAAETFDTFSFQRGFIFMQMSTASMVWVFRTVLQMGMAVVVAVIVFLCVRTRADESTSRDISDSEQNNLAGVIPGVLCALAFVASLFIPVAFGSIFESAVLQAVGNSVLVTVFSAVLFGIPLFLFTVWLCTNINKIGALILMLLLVAIVNNIIGEFLYYRTLGLFNTHLILIFANALNLTFVLPIAYLARLKHPDITTFGKLMRSLLPYLTAFLGLFTATTWGSSFSQVLYTTRVNDWGVSMLLRQIMTFGQLSTEGLIFWISIPVLVIAAATVVVFTLMDKDVTPAP